MEGRVSAAQTSGPYKAYELAVTFSILQHCTAVDYTFFLRNPKNQSCCIFCLRLYHLLYFLWSIDTFCMQIIPIVLDG